MVANPINLREGFTPIGFSLVDARTRVLLVESVGPVQGWHHGHPVRVVEYPSRANLWKICPLM